MLLQEQMKQDIFSYNERTIIDFILEKQEKIKNYSTKMIGDETYTAPSTVIRIAHKLGFQGWSDLKEAYLDEVIYLNNHFQEIDPNYPFTNQDTMMQIAHKITQLHIESAKDTASLIHHDTLQKAIQILRKANVVKVFAIANLNFIGEEFVFKLNRIHKKAYIEPVQDNQFQDAIMTTSDECAICLSYSGETPTLLKTANFLRENKVPIIAITSFGKNSLSDLATVTLNVSTREKSFSKIAGFTSLESMNIVLNILYSCLFSLNYQVNLDYKINVAKRVELNREIDNEVIEEHLKED